MSWVFSISALEFEWNSKQSKGWGSVFFLWTEWDSKWAGGFSHIFSRTAFGPFWVLNIFGPILSESWPRKVNLLFPGLGAGEVFRWENMP